MSKCLLLMKRKKCDFSYDVTSKHVMGMTWWRAAAQTKYWSQKYWCGVRKIQKSRKFMKSRWCQCACCVRNPENPESQMMIWCTRNQEIYMMNVVGGVRRCSTGCKKLIRNEENGVWSFMIQDQFWWSPFCSNFDCQPVICQIIVYKENTTKHKWSSETGTDRRETHRKIDRERKRERCVY